jgi:hypothetical protein
VKAHKFPDWFSLGDFTNLYSAIGQPRIRAAASESVEVASADVEAKEEVMSRSAVGVLLFVIAAGLWVVPAGQGQSGDEKKAEGAPRPLV